MIHGPDSFATVEGRAKRTSMRTRVLNRVLRYRLSLAGGLFQ